MLIQWPDKYYHTSEDTIDKVDPKMLKVAGVLTATYLYTAASPTPGDAAVIADEAAARFAVEADAQLSALLDKVQEESWQLSREARAAKSGGPWVKHRARQQVNPRVKRQVKLQMYQVMQG